METNSSALQQPAELQPQTATPSATAKAPKSFGFKLLEWLLMPAKKCTIFFVIGILSWFLLWLLTDWSKDYPLIALPWLVCDLYIVTLLICLLPGRWRVAALVTAYIIIYLTGFAESFIYQRYYMHFTPQTLTMITETTGEETSGFINLCLEAPKFWLSMLWWFILFFVHIIILLGRKLVSINKPKAKLRVQKWAQLIIVPLCLISLIWWIPARIDIVRFLNVEHTDMAEKVDTSVFYSTLWRAVYSFKFEQLSQKELNTLAHNMEHLEATGSDNGVPLIILVIGESHNKHHSAVYGYNLPTTPFQSQCQADSTMVAFTDAITPWNVTSSVFKNMFSTHSTDQSGLWTDGVLFPALFRKAGYTVDFYSNQFYKTNRQNSANYNGSFFLNSQPFDSLCFNRRNKKHYVYDLGLLNELKNDYSQGKHLVIIHLLGQHQPYADRIPKGMKHFKESDIPRKDLTKQERQIIADYDNATLVNDSVLKRLYLKVQDKPALIVYVADHGDEVYDGNIGMFGRNHMADPSPEIMWAEFEVPLEFFVTPKLQSSHPHLLANLKAAQKRPFSIDDLPHVLLGIAGIQAKYYDAKRDVTSDTFLSRPRPIKGLKKTYDEIVGKTTK